MGKWGQSRELGRFIFSSNFNWLGCGKSRLASDRGRSVHSLHTRVAELTWRSSTLLLAQLFPYPIRGRSELGGRVYTVRQPTPFESGTAKRTSTSRTGPRELRGSSLTTRDDRVYEEPIHEFHESGRVGSCAVSRAGRGDRGLSRG